MRKPGFSVVEVMLAAALFVIFSTGAVTLLIQGLGSNRLSAEQTVANQYAAEGLEAARSIRNRDFALLSNTAGTGIAKSAGVWIFSGANNTLDKYTRIIKIESVNRDGSGNIVASGGTTDPKTKKVTSTVNWSYNAGRQNSVVLTAYMSYWREALSPNKNGMLVYGDGGTTSDAIRYRIFDAGTGTWGTANLAADVDTTSTNRALQVVKLFSSEAKNEKVMISRHYNGTTQYIYAQVWNGTSWGNVALLHSWASTTFLDAQNFGGAYLANGDFMAVYSDNSTSPEFMIWNGSVWSAPVALPTGTGIPMFIVVKNRPDTNEVMAAFYNQANDTATRYFNGGTYTSGNWAFVLHSSQAPVNTKRMIDFTWSPNDPLSGALVYSDRNNDKNVNIKIFTANGTGGGTWSGTQNTGSATNGNLGAMEISGRSAVEEYVACDKDATNRIYCFESSGVPTWVTPTNNLLTTTSQAGIQRSFDMDFEKLADEGIAVYSDNTTVPKLRKYNPTTNAFDAAATSLNTLGGILNTVKLVSLSRTNDVMILLGNANRGLNTVVWNGTANAVYTTPAGKAFTAQGTNGYAAINYWYDFNWDEY
jgi:Tfp pilus assembly protein PilV